MGIGSVALHNSHKHRDSLKHLPRWIGLVLGSILLIGIATGQAGDIFAHSATAGWKTEDALISVAPAATSPSAFVQASGAAQPAQIDPAQAEGIAQSGNPLQNSTASVANQPCATPAVQAIESETRQDRPLRTAVKAPPVQTWPFPGSDLYIHLPPDATPSEPLQVILALHGMGGQGEAFAHDLIADADRNHWLIVAPTLPYGDYMNPAQLAEDDVRLSQMLAATLDALPQRLGYKLLPQVLIFGFSRGAQLGHRFAMFYPERVEAVAILAAGSYTFPAKVGMTELGLKPLLLPYGLADAEARLSRTLNMDQFQKIPFLIAVGDKDTRSEDVPRQFDFLGGTTRLARAQSFNRALKLLGMDCQLVIAPNADHQVSSEMLVSASKFLKEKAPKPSQVNKANPSQESKSSKLH